MKNDIENTLTALAARRPIFHSEADLQHAFATQLRETNPHLDIRLEVPFQISSKRAYIDMVVRCGKRIVFVELKYKTRLLLHTHVDEQFALKNQGARDHGSYDILKDVQRLESFVAATPDSEGISIVVTNDPGYWSRTQRSSPTIDEAFKLYDGRLVTGTLEWHPDAGFGSIEKREQPIELKGTYSVHWKNYAVISEQAATFRSLCFHVTPTGSEVIQVNIPIAPGPPMAPNLPFECAKADERPRPQPTTLKREPNWKLVLQTVENLGGCSTLSQIKERFARDYPDRKVINVRHELVMMAVNHEKRIHYSPAKKPRLSNSGNPVDQLYYRSDGSFERYDRHRHGIWEISAAGGGQMQVRKVNML